MSFVTEETAQQIAEQLYTLVQLLKKMDTSRPAAEPRVPQWATGDARDWVVIGCAENKAWIANPTTPLLTETEARIKHHDLSMAYPNHTYSVVCARWRAPEMRA